MTILPGYTITDTIYQGRKTVVYRGIRKRDRLPVIIKIPKNEYPTFEEITLLRQEYTIPQKLNCTGIAKPYSLEKYHNSFALVLEDFGGQSIHQFLTQEKFEIKEFLSIAISLATTLIKLHRTPIIHKDIKPSNIIINPETREVKITDFSIAITLPKEQQTIVNPKLLEGTLAYMSPEQTGRMNRALDYRSDFYSLGVTFYEILTGQLPFTSQDPMELVYCHIAKKPVPPCQVVEAQGGTPLPTIVSDIVMKLLEKNAEDRYQSAAGLKFDLETCLRQLEATGEITNFTLGTRDRGNQLLIPQKLYGREQEVATLLAAFNRVAGREAEETSQSPSPNSKSKIELMLVSGYSGIGKTSIINEVHKPIVAARGYFIAGKFDQFKRNIPYAAIIQAFGELIHQLLTENEQQIAVWKAKLLDALGTNGQIIIDVIPEVELIIGSQPEVSKVGSLEAQNRFNRLFQQFVRVFCQPEHPLVIFLDDLQWVDSASLKLIELLVTDESSQYLLMIGAYRDNEVSPTHPLIQTLEKIKATNTVVNNITVKSLSSANVSQLAADTFNASIQAEKLQKFSQLIFNKTQGNPFFLTQLLKTLYVENLLVYQVEIDSWQWDIEEIQAIGITDYNVVELMVRNIRKLPETTQKVLKFAACIGNQFNLDVLAIVNEESSIVTASYLWEALQAGLILPIGETYKIPLVFAQEELAGVQDVKVDYRFVHDRVQQAAYSLILESEKKETHLKIGQLLLQNMTLQERKDNIFALVNQLNFGTELLKNQTEKYELAELNLIAGQKAKVNTAYEAAVNYLNFGLELLEENSWQYRYDLTLAFYLDTSEAEYLNANLERSIILCDIALKQAKTILEQVKFYQLKINLNLAQSQIQSALDLGLQVLEILGVSLSESPPQGLNIQKLAELPQMTEPYKLAAMQVLMQIFGPACFGDAKLSLPILYTMIDLSRRYGNSPPAIYAYCNYGGIVSWLIPDIDFGYQLGQLALNVLDKLDAKEFKSKAILTFCITIQHWKEHTRKTIEPLRQAIQDALEVGDIEFACHAADFYCAHSFFVGEPLELVTEKVAHYIEFIKRFKQEYQLNLLKMFGQTVFNLREISDSRCPLSGDIFNEQEKAPQFLEENNVISLFYLHFFKSRLSYLFKNYSGALGNAESASHYSHFVRNIILFVESNFYYSLALIAQYGNTHSQGNGGSEIKQQYLKQIEENQEKMRYWAHHCPMNYQHKYDLIEAEKARVLGQVLEAMEYYDRAIAGATENAYIQDEALANELAAEFYLSLGRQKVARTYMIDAYYGYIRWGAKAKFEDLEARYPQLLAPILNNKQIFSTSETIVQISTGTVNSSGSGIANALDLATILKASQALSGEIHLDQLLSTLMQVLLENAGAEKFYLLMPSQVGNWRIEAQCIGEQFELTSISVTESQDLPLSLIYYVQRTQKTLVIDDARAEITFATDRYIIQQQPKAVLCTPIVNQGKLIGILYLENNLTTGAFTRDRIEVLKILSSQAAISIENARLYQTLENKVAERTVQLAQANQEITALNEKLEEENLRLSAELEVTKRLQQMILPKPSELEAIEGLEIAGFMEPADEVGGDYYDVLSRDDKVKISIGDVTGHGLESGVLMIMAQTAVRTLQQINETDPVKFIDVLNRTLYGNLQRINSFKNMTLALLDYQNGILSLSGQHEEIIVVRTDGKVERINTMPLGFPIGLEEEIAEFIAQTQVLLNSGDVVVLYTDGITEAEDINRRLYGIERLCEVARKNRDLAAAEIRQVVIEDLRQYIGMNKIFDDITLVILKQK